MFRRKHPLERWQQHRDPAAFRELVERHSGMVFATCRRMLRDRTAAEDVTQECFVALAQSDRVRPEAVGAWLYGVATRQCLHRLRTERRRHEREDLYATSQETQTMSSWNDVQEHVDAAIAQLPEELRNPLVAHYVEGKSHAAIARECGVPRRTISHRIERAVEVTSEGLRKKGIAVGAVSLAPLLGAHLAEAAPISAALAASLAKLALSTGSAATAASSGILAELSTGTYTMKTVISGLVAVALVAGVGVYLANRTVAETAPVSAVAPAMPGEPAPTPAISEVSVASTEPTVAETVDEQPAPETVSPDEN